MEDHTQNAPTPEAPSKSVSCRASIEDLYRYMDGHVEESRRQQIQHHLDLCGGCDEVYHFEATILKMVGQKCRTEMPDGLRQRVLGTIIGPDLQGALGPDLRSDFGADRRL